MGSLRFRLAAIYSLGLFGLAGHRRRRHLPRHRGRLDDEPCRRRDRSSSGSRPDGTSHRREVSRATCRTFEKEVNRRALERAAAATPSSALGVLFLVSLGVGWIVAGRVLRPIERITGVAHDIQATDLSRRIDLPGPPDELKNLADTFDEMLGRLESAFEHQRQFIHEASHELRNPIAVIRTNVEVALADPDASRRGPAATRRGGGPRRRARMGVLVDDLLTYARREAPAMRETGVDLGRLVAEPSAEFAAPGRDPAPRLVEPAARSRRWRCIGDPVALKQALANLLANAVRLAPEGPAVPVAGGRRGPVGLDGRRRRGPRHPRRGPGAGVRALLAGRPAADPGRGPHGLGLTIVRQVAEAPRRRGRAGRQRPGRLDLHPVAPRPEPGRRPRSTRTRRPPVPLGATARSRLRSHRPPDRSSRAMTIVIINAITVPSDSGDGWPSGSPPGPGPSTTRRASRASSCSSPPTAATSGSSSPAGATRSRSRRG